MYGTIILWKLMPHDRMATISELDAIFDVKKITVMNTNSDLLADVEDNHDADNQQQGYKESEYEFLDYIQIKQSGSEFHSLFV